MTLMKKFRAKKLVMTKKTKYMYTYGLFSKTGWKST